MKSCNQGWCMCIMLVILGILMIAAISSYQTSSYIFMIARMRYRSHQKVKLMEGLLKYGTSLCKENKSLLIPWGMQTENTMYVTIDPWPSASLVPLFGHYAGSLSITSKQGIIYVSAQLVSKKNTIISGICTMCLEHKGDLKSDLIITSWNTVEA